MMAAKMTAVYRSNFLIFVLNIIVFIGFCDANDILGCGGFVKSHANMDFSKIEIGLYTKEGSLKEKTECAPTNGYYFLPLYEKGDYVLRIHPPAGWSFEPSQVDLTINGVDDRCSMGEDVNFTFNGFGITGRVITAGDNQGPSGITVQLLDDTLGIRETVTGVGGDFHFTPVIPGKYTVKASHPRWKLEPSQAIVQVKEGNTELAAGSLAVRGYDVKGSIHTNGNPISGLYVLLYSKENLKFRVEGCKTALLQGVPDAPICYSITDAAGEFSFGLVPAGEYKLLALSKAPGQNTVSYNVRPDSVKFTVKHDSLFIKNAFEVTGFTVSGSVVSSPGGAGVSGARVSLDGLPAASSDAAGRYTLPPLSPAVYTLTIEHELAQFEPVKLSISGAGRVAVESAAAARWRVCGAVRGGARRAVLLRGAGGALTAHADHTENWCTFLAPGVYTAKVEVTEQEQRDGLQFYPLTQKITVASSPVSDIIFSQLKATLTGTIKCLDDNDTACRSVTVTCRPLSPDGGYVGKPITTQAKDGQYTLVDVLPGSVEVSVGTGRYCWAAAAHNVAVAAAHHALPAFTQRGHALHLQSTHDILVEYTSAKDNGTLSVPAGESQQCVGTADVYRLAPRSCHLVQPTTAEADTRLQTTKMIHFVAVAHEVGVTVTSSEKVDDLTLKVIADSGVTSVGPIVPEKVGNEYVYTHTLHMTEGEVSVFTPSSATLLFNPPSVQVVGSGRCARAAANIVAAKGLLLEGRLEPRVQGATITLTSEDLVQTQTTGPEGTYRFGPLDASKAYQVIAEKESYSMSEPDEEGIIRARKLAEILVELKDDADGSSLEGALVSVSGGSYRRTLVSGAEGRLRFSSLPPALYYVKPHMKEYKFTPPHATLNVQEGATHQHTLVGVRVACRAYGRVVWPSGAGCACALLATPTAAAAAAASPHCAAVDTRTDDEGNFRLRGLVPGCTYSVQLKPPTDSALPPMLLAHAPRIIEVTEKKDIYGLRLIAIQPNHLTDTNVLVYTPFIEHYKTLRIKLALEDSPTSPIYTTKLDPAGFSEHVNPGLMYPLPRLPADNKTYVIHLESSLATTSHSYEDQSVYFTSDGNFKHFDLEFLPKVRSSEQELRQSSLLALLLLGVVAAAFLCRDTLVQKLTAAAPSRIIPRPSRAVRPEFLDAASIEQIVSSVSGQRKQTKRKTQLAG